LQLRCRAVSSESNVSINHTMFKLPCLYQVYILALL